MNASADIRYLTLSDILYLYNRVMVESGGLAGVRDIGLLESAITQPRLTFEGQPLYPTLAEKAAALCYALIQNHPFIDGNKRIAHAAMETFLILNGFQIEALVDEQERVMLALAKGEMERESLVLWLQKHIVPLEGGGCP